MSRQLFSSLLQLRYITLLISKPSTFLNIIFHSMTSASAPECCYLRIEMGGRLRKYHVYSATSSNELIHFLISGNEFENVEGFENPFPFYYRIGHKYIYGKCSFLWASWSLSSCSSFLWRMVPARPITAKITFWHIFLFYASGLVSIL